MREVRFVKARIHVHMYSWLPIHIVKYVHNVTSFMFISSKDQASNGCGLCLARAE